MSEFLIANVKLVEKWKRAIPVLKRMHEQGGSYYVAGTLVLSMPDPATDKHFTTIDIEPIDDYASEIIREGQYWASLIYVQVKGPSCHYYSLARENIDKYECMLQEAT